MFKGAVHPLGPLAQLSGVSGVQRAACDAYGIIVNVLTSDQHNWCVCLCFHVRPPEHDLPLAGWTSCSSLQKVWLSAIRTLYRRWPING